MEFLNPILKTLNNLATGFISHVPNATVAIFFLIITFLFVKICNRLLGNNLIRFGMHANLILVFQKILSIIVWLVCLLIIFAILFPSVTVSSILTTLGLTSVAIGFAFKDIFQNFLSGILILLREPFRFGDFIETEDQEGYVEKISIRNTHLRRSDGVRVVIPNAQLINDPIQVLTDLDLRRAKIDFSVGFHEDIHKIKSITKNVVENCETVSKEKYIQICVTSFSPNGIDFLVYWWTKSKPKHIRLSRDEVLSKLKAMFDEEKIKLNYTTTISFDNSLALHKEVDTE